MRSDFAKQDKLCWHVWPCYHGSGGSPFPVGSNFRSGKVICDFPRSMTGSQLSNHSAKRREMGGFFSANDTLRLGIGFHKIQSFKIHLGGFVNRVAIRYPGIPVSHITQAIWKSYDSHGDDLGTWGTCRGKKSLKGSTSQCTQQMIFTQTHRNSHVCFPQSQFQRRILYQMHVLFWPHAATSFLSFETPTPFIDDLPIYLFKMIFDSQL